MFFWEIPVFREGWSSSVVERLGVVGGDKIVVLGCRGKKGVGKSIVVQILFRVLVQRSSCSRAICVGQLSSLKLKQPW